ncbi:MAG: hypothetical protein ACQEXJ_12670 [Myxococcota bacterium]
MRMLTPLTTLALLLAAPAALAAEGGFVMEEHGFYIIDFVVFIGALWWFTRGPARRFLEERHDAVRKEMEAAAELRREAEERLRTYEARLRDLDDEIARMREDFRKDGERERERILAEAEAATERIRRDTQATVSHETSQLKQDLEAEIVERALDMAEEIVRDRMSADQHKRLVRGFIGDLESRGDLGSLSA